MMELEGDSPYPLQVLLQDQSGTLQAGLSQPGATQPEALGVDRHHRWVHVHLEQRAASVTQSSRRDTELVVDDAAYLKVRIITTGRLIRLQ